MFEKIMIGGLQLLTDELIIERDSIIIKELEEVFNMDFDGIDEVYDLLTAYISAGYTFVIDDTEIVLLQSNYPSVYFEIYINDVLAHRIEVFKLKVTFTLEG